jgi:MoaA/NifB/PqqE/SkfB family radical SAM enzyme
MLSDIQNTATIRMHGWHHDANFCEQKISSGQMIHLLAETTNVCNQDCEYCYTVQLTLDKPGFHNSVMPGELTLTERKKLIDQAVELGAVSYDIVGAGEPTIDRLFKQQVEYAASKGMIPIIFTNGSMIGHPKHGFNLAQFLFDVGATVVVKWHSFDQSLHDQIVRRKGAGQLRDTALECLKAFGFNRHSPTRLGIDNIIYRSTIGEIPDCLRMCRQENIFLVCSSFIPSGRTEKGNQGEVVGDELVSLYEQCREIDYEEFGIKHSAAMPFIGYGRTCTQYFGLYVTIQGQVYGCVGQSENYGNIRQRSLSEVWTERLPLLKAYDGGCPPRAQYYSAGGKLVQIQPLFNKK